jgi:hypothetical protein
MRPAQKLHRRNREGGEAPVVTADKLAKVLEITLSDLFLELEQEDLD